MRARANSSDTINKSWNNFACLRVLTSVINSARSNRHGSTPTEAQDRART